MYGRLIKGIMLVILGIIILFAGIKALVDKKNRSESEERDKALLYIPLIGLVSILVGGFTAAEELTDMGVISIDRTSAIWQVAQIFMLVLIALIFGSCALLYRKRIVNKNEIIDSEIIGTVTGYCIMPSSHSLPGYGKPLIEYTDPYDGNSYTFRSLRDVRKKKYPEGSRYRLLYSRDMRRAYEDATNRANRDMLAVCIFIVAVIVIGVASFILKLVMG